MSLSERLLKWKAGFSTVLEGSLQIPFLFLELRSLYKEISNVNDDS